MLNGAYRSQLRDTSPPGTIGVMARTTAREKARLKRLTDRLDFLKRWFSELDHEKPRQVTAELVKDALDLVTQTRKAIAAKRFEAVLLYHELEYRHRFLAEQLDEIPEVLGRAQRDARSYAKHLERQETARHTAAKRRGRDERVLALTYIERKGREEFDVLVSGKARAQLVKDVAAMMPGRKAPGSKERQASRLVNLVHDQLLNERADRESKSSAARGHLHARVRLTP